MGYTYRYEWPQGVWVFERIWSEKGYRFSPFLIWKGSLFHSNLIWVYCSQGTVFPHQHQQICSLSQMFTQMVSCGHILEPCIILETWSVVLIFRSGLKYDIENRREFCLKYGSGRTSAAKRLWSIPPPPGPASFEILSRGALSLCLTVISNWVLTSVHLLLGLCIQRISSLVDGTGWHVKGQPQFKSF